MFSLSIILNKTNHIKKCVTEICHLKNYYSVDIQTIIYLDPKNIYIAFINNNIYLFK